MYKGTRKGSTKGVSGKQYSWVIGQEIDVEKKELSGAYGLEWIEPNLQTKKEIMEVLDEKGIEYDGRSKKADLEKLL